MYPDHLRYSRRHVWAKLNNSQAVIGITHYAQEQLGNIIYVELPQLGAQVSADMPFAVVESAKSVSDIYSPVTGEVKKVNEALIEIPSLINEDPYQKGWIAVVALFTPEELDSLLDAQGYQKFLEE